jgi:hypothetical protein
MMTDNMRSIMCTKLRLTRIETSKLVSINNSTKEVNLVSWVGANISLDS